MEHRLPLRAFIVVVSAVLITAVSAQLNIVQLGHLDYDLLRNSDLSNLWGYVDEQGNEYALVGVNGDDDEQGSGGFSVVDVTDPANPVEVFFTPGPNSIWREIKTWGDHAYITTEEDAGLLIVDLSPLPESTDLPVTTFEGEGWITSHSLFIDENGRLYINGANRGEGGCIFYDLTQDPEAPVEVGEYDDFYVHDCYARGDTLYAAHVSDGFFSIVDVSDPSAPDELGTRSTPNTFTHNCWLDDSGQYLFTTDETPDSYLAAYDVSDPTDILFLDKLQTNPGSNAVIHNTYWLNGYVVQSYYTEGVSIYDVHDPTNIVEVGHYDTSPFAGEGFNGAWGVYPFLPSGNLLVSDIQQGLFILAPTYTEACRLEGLITDATTSQPVDQATIVINGTTGFDVTEDFDGLYSTGWAIAGVYSITVSAYGYMEQTVEGIVLANGQVTTLDVQLVPLVPFDLVFTVVEAGGNVPIVGAQVVISNESVTESAITDANGQFIVPGFYEGGYDIEAAHWGHLGVCLTEQMIAPTSHTMELEAGYADDFSFDLGWVATGDAESGEWDRGVPDGNTYDEAPCAPGVDAEEDCGDLAYVTGNGGGQAGSDDVDDGTVVLTSPAFDATLTSDPWIRYQRWWFTGAGDGPTDDALLVRLDNGDSVVTVEELDGGYGSMGEWMTHEFRIADLITPTADMRLVMETADGDPGHLVEAGLDRFEVLPASPFLALPIISAHAGITVYPDPSDGAFTVRAPDIIGRVRVLDAMGAEIAKGQQLVNGTLDMSLEVPAGLYLLRIEAEGGAAYTHRMVVH